MDDNRISVREAAYILNETEQFIRISVRRNLIPIGIAIESESKSFESKIRGHGRYNYYIYLSKVEEYLGKKIDIQKVRKEMEEKGLDYVKKIPMAKTSR